MFVNNFKYSLWVFGFIRLNNFPNLHIFQIIETFKTSEISQKLGNLEIIDISKNFRNSENFAIVKFFGNLKIY